MLFKSSHYRDNHLHVMLRWHAPDLPASNGEWKTLRIFCFVQISFIKSKWNYVSEWFIKRRNSIWKVETKRKITKKQLTLFDTQKFSNKILKWNLIFRFPLIWRYTFSSLHVAERYRFFFFLNLIGHMTNHNNAWIQRFLFKFVWHLI